MPFTCFSKKSTVDKNGSMGVKPAGLAMTSSQDYLDAIAKRRSIYSLGSKLPHSKKSVTKLIEAAIREGPSPFNVQSSRAVIVYGDEHKKVWEITKEALKKVTKEDQYAASEAKVNNCFLAGAGTILFYEDDIAIKGQQQEYPTYADHFPTWSQHSSAIAQFAVWTALAHEGIGASLQHYNQLIDAQLREAFDVPEHWQLIAQMPFGSIEKPADAKTYIPDENRFMVLDD